MSSEDRQSLSSAFDNMLKDARRELDGLFDGSVTARADERPTASSPYSPPPKPRKSSPQSSSRSANLSDAERFLNDRYADGWRREILERKRDGNEVVVLCKLIVEDHDISKTQFGRARVGGGNAVAVGGTSGGVSFGVGGSRERDRTSGENAESVAYRVATADALAKCVAML